MLMPVKELLVELRQLCSPRVLRTDEESRRVALRKQEICREFGEQYPEDVFDRFLSINKQGA